MKKKTSKVTDGPSILIGPLYRTYASPLGSQKDDTGTSHRRRRTLSCPNDDCTVSSRVLVTLRDAFPGCGSTKPPPTTLRLTPSRRPLPMELRSIFAALSIWQPLSDPCIGVFPLGLAIVRCGDAFEDTGYVR